MRFWKWTATIIAIVSGLIWFNNTSIFSDPADGPGLGLIAHRGVHQLNVASVRDNETCRARKMAPMTHSFIENTLPSIEAAFESGADVVEIDVHRTTDDVLMVFHDWRLECQTDGHGETSSKSSDELRALDLGFGFTEDDENFPLRGGKAGPMPSLEEILTHELDGTILVNFKSRRQSDGKHFVALLEETGAHDAVFAVYGGEAPTQEAIASINGMKGYDRTSLLTCLKSYMAFGWSGWVPGSCRNTLIGVPIDYAPYVWGWPHKFTERMANVGTDVILWGPYDGSGFTSGIDSAETLALVPDGFDGFIWTNVIETIGPIVDEMR